MSFEKLSLSGFIQEVVDVSSGPHPRKFCFILGAGASRSSGIKSGQELVNIWDRELRQRNPEDYWRWKAELGITDENKYGFYSQYYEKRFFRQPSDGYNFLEKLMEDAKPSSGYVMLSYLLTKTQHNLVITTNFDHLIEDAVNYYEQIIPLVIGHEALAHYISGRVTRPTIIKIHRDLLFDPKNSTVELKELHKNWETALSLVFTEYHPIFIGYAGNDESLMGFLLENSAKFQDGKWRYPYWLLYKSDPLDGKILEFLQRAGGYSVRHEGFDETLYLLGANLGYKMPAKEVFLSDAEKRFQSLADAIDSFTEKLSNKEERPSSSVGTGDGEITDINRAILQVTDSSEQQSMYGEAMKLYNDDNYPQSIAILQKLVEMDPENAKYHSALGRALLYNKNPEAALPAMKKAIELEPEQARYYSDLGDILNALGEYDQALDEIEKAVALDPENALYYSDLGRTLRELDRWDESLLFIQKAIEMEPDSAYYHYNAGFIQNQMEKYDDALREFQAAIELEPMNAFYHYMLGDVLSSLEHYDEAVKEMQEAVKLKPTDAFYNYCFGEALETVGDQENALPALRKAVELAPDDKLYLEEFGDLLEKMGRHDEAAEVQERLAKL